MSAMRRDLESTPIEHDYRAVGSTMSSAIVVEADRVRIVRELWELIAALDRRLPQVHRAGEAAIAEAAAQLRTAALGRIEILERDLAAGTVV